MAGVERAYQCRQTFPSFKEEATSNLSLNDNLKIVDFEFLGGKNITDFSPFTIALMCENGFIYLVSAVVLPGLYFTKKEISQIKEKAK